MLEFFKKNLHVIFYTQNAHFKRLARRKFKKVFLWIILMNTLQFIAPYSILSYDL